MAGRCRLCTTNDRDGLVEQLAAEMWDRHRDRELMGSWEEASEHWHRTMRDFARATLDMLEDGHR